MLFFESLKIARMVGRCIGAGQRTDIYICEVREQIELNGVSLELKGCFLLPDVVKHNDTVTVQLLHPEVKERSIYGHRLGYGGRRQEGRYMKPYFWRNAIAIDGHSGP
jgi:hypothetical protein